VLSSYGSSARLRARLFAFFSYRAYEIFSCTHITAEGLTGFPGTRHPRCDISRTHSTIPPKDDKKKDSDARKAAGDAVWVGKEIEKEEGFWSGDDRLTGVMDGTFKGRRRKFLTTKENKDSVHAALLEVAPVVAARLGFDSLDLPQGRLWLENYLKLNMDGGAQLMASSGPLNRGHGPKAAPTQKKTAEQTGEPGEDGLLAPGATPQTAIDVDDASDNMKPIVQANGRAYENRLRQIDNLYLETHPNDPKRRFYMETRRVHWAFKMYAQERGVWDVAHFSLTPTLPHDIPEDTWLFPESSCMLCFHTI